MNDDAFELDGCTLSSGCCVGEALDAAGVDGGLDRHGDALAADDGFENDAGDRAHPSEP